jgi:hypothetical protein
MPKTTPATSSAKRVRLRRKSLARPPRPGPSDVIADRFDIDKVDCAPSWKFGFSLHMGGDGGHWSGRVGRMEMPQERAVDLALKILGVTNEFGAPFTDKQRKRIAEFALGPVFSKRHDGVTARYNARDITLDQAKHLGEEIREQFDEAVKALVAA